MLQRFLVISKLLERILMEHIEQNYSQHSELSFDSICSVKNRSRNRDIIEKLYSKPFFDDNSSSRTNSNETFRYEK